MPKAVEVHRIEGAQSDRPLKMFDRNLWPNQIRIEPSTSVPGHGRIGIERQRLLDQSQRYVQIADDRMRCAQHCEHHRIIAMHITRQLRQTQPLSLGLVGQRRPVVGDLSRLAPCRQRECKRVVRLDLDGLLQVI